MTKKNTGIDCLVQVLEAQAASPNGIGCFINVLDALSDCDCNEVEGCISLNQGHHEIAVKTAITPSEVFLSVTPIGIPVCGGDIDMVGYSLLPDGFVLYADIKSNIVEVCYFVEA